MKINFNKFPGVFTLLVSAALFSLHPGNLSAQVGLNETFEGITALPPGWTGTSWFNTALLPCNDLRSVRTNLWSSGPQRTLLSPTWVSNGEDLDISFVYKLINFSAPNDPTPLGFGSITLAYSTDGGTTYTDVLVIDDANHVVSGTCVPKNLTIPGASLPTGNTIRLRWFGQWVTGDYYYYMDDIVVLQEANEPPSCNAALTSPANGAPAASIDGNLTWSAASGVPTGYNVTVTQITGGPSIVYNESLGSVTSVNVGQLAYSTEYSVDIVPFNSFGNATGCTTYGFTTQDQPAPGTDCFSPLEITGLPYADSGNTADYGDIYSSTQVPPLPAQYPFLSTGTGSGSYINGDEVVYKYTPASNTGVNITVSNHGTWVGLWVFQGCPFSSIVAYHTVSDALGRAINNLPLMGGVDYYIVISTFPAPQSTVYDLSIVEVALDCPSIGSNIGWPCDDGDPNTVADVVQADCSCSGVPPLTNFTACTAEVVGCGTSLYGTTVGATVDNVPTCVTTNGTGGGVWYEFLPSNNGFATVSTCGSFYNTRLRVYTGECDAFTCVTGNADFPGCGPGFTTNSQVTFEVASGSRYFILVHGLTTQVGTFALNISCVDYDCPQLEANIGDICDFNGDLGSIGEDCECQELTYNGCTNGTLFGSRIPTCTTQATPITGSFVNEYSNITVINQATYTFEAFGSVNLPNIFITITNADASVIYATGANSLVWQSNGDQIVRFFSHGAPDCSSAFTGSASSHTRQVTIDCSTIIYDCQDIQAFFGDPCDDGDPSTFDDVIQADCSCAGTPYDCVNLNLNIGDFCSINNGAGVVLADCSCDPIPFDGCLATTQFGVRTPTCEVQATPITSAWVNEYSSITVLNQATYTFVAFGAVNIPNIFITITNSDNSVIYATGINSVVWQSNADQVVRFHSHGAIDCTSEFTGSESSHTRQVTIDCSTIIYDCPDIQAFFGDPCDDGDPTTYGATVQTDCTCLGIPYDCQNLLLNVGDPCDDGDPATIFDTVQADCTCQGGPAPVGDICGNPIVVGVLPYTTTDNTANYLSDYTNADRPPLPPVYPSPVSTGTASDFYMTGPDVVYSYTSLTNTTLNVGLTGITLNGWVALWVFEGCPFTTLVAFHTGLSGDVRDILNLPIAAGQTYYIMVATWQTQTASTPYTLNITDNNPTDCPALGLDIGDVCDANGNPGTVDANCDCVPDGGCNVNGGTVSTNSPRLNLCKGDGVPNIVQLDITGNTSPGRFGIARQSDLQIIATNATGTFNMETYPAGSYFGGYVAVEDLSQLAGVTNVNQLSGCFDLSNQILITSIQLTGGTLTTTSPSTVCGGNVTVSVAGNQGPLQRYALLNQTLTTVLAQNTTGVFNFTSLAPGIYRIASISYTSSVNLGAIVPPTLPPCVVSSNLITITRQACATAAIESSPNPTTGTSWVTFSVPTEDYTTLEVYDMSGRKVTELFNQVTQKDMEYRLEFNGAGLPNGVYIYRLTTADEVLIDKFMIAK